MLEMPMAASGPHFHLAVLFQQTDHLAHSHWHDELIVCLCRIPAATPARGFGPVYATPLPLRKDCAGTI
jgi:hypothetical protein